MYSSVSRHHCRLWQNTLFISSYGSAVEQDLLGVLHLNKF